MKHTKVASIQSVARPNPPFILQTALILISLGLMRIVTFGSEPRPLGRFILTPNFQLLTSNTPLLVAGYFIYGLLLPVS